jgi:hypothetical protein
VLEVSRLEASADRFRSSAAAGCQRTEDYAIFQIANLLAYMLSALRGPVNGKMHVLLRRFPFLGISACRAIEQVVVCLNGRQKFSAFRKELEGSYQSVGNPRGYPPVK